MGGDDRAITQLHIGKKSFVTLNKASGDERFIEIHDLFSSAFWSDIVVNMLSLWRGTAFHCEFYYLFVERLAVRINHILSQGVSWGKANCIQTTLRQQAAQMDRQ